MRILSIVLLSSLIFMPAKAFAEFTIATVDMTRLLQEGDKSKSERERLEELSEEAVEKIEDLKEPLTDMEARIKSGDVIKTSPEAEKFRNDVKAFMRFTKDTEESIKKQIAEARGSMIKLTYDTVQQYAVKSKIDIVFDASTTSRSFVLRKSGAVDITDDVLELLNE